MSPPFCHVLGIFFSFFFCERVCDYGGYDIMIQHIGDIKVMVAVMGTRVEATPIAEIITGNE